MEAVMSAIKEDKLISFDELVVGSIYEFKLINYFSKPFENESDRIKKNVIFKTKPQTIKAIFLEKSDIIWEDEEN